MAQEKLTKKLILAEKPSVARDIARVLNCNQKEIGCLTNKEYIVTWALGHLVTLADPEIYDTKYQKWEMEHLPMIPKEMELVVIKQTSKQYSVVKNALKRPDVTEVIIATDAGREGELVARWIIEKAKINKPIKRLWISSVTDKAIKDGFKNLKNGKEYEHLYASAASRAEADWLVGINATRALTCKFNAQLSCGRVQTPTVALIQKREEEIKNFKETPFYGIEAIGNGLKFTWQEKTTGSYRSFQKEKVKQIIDLLNDKKEKAVVIDVNKSFKKIYSKPLYDLTELQREANKRFGFSAKETLNIMQRLYENHKVLTYPRTDSRYITSDMVSTLKERIKALPSSHYGKFAKLLLNGEIKGSSQFVDNQKVTDHHAIIPTEQGVSINQLSVDEYKIYDMVVKRFLAVLYPPFEYEQTMIKLEVLGEVFVAKGKVIKSQGFKVIYENIVEDDTDEELKEQILPSIQKGEKVLFSNLKITDGKTKPPMPYNEGTLLSAMEQGNLGTVATRADIIEKIFNSFYIEKHGNNILITKKGKQLLELVPKDLKTPELTAKWEEKLLKISKGILKKDDFIRDIEKYTGTIIEEIKLSQNTFKHDNITGKRCPECGKFLLSVNSKTGKMLVCQDRDCGYRKNTERITNSRCPQCHKKLLLQGEGEKQYFTCSCGHRENLSSFKKRKENEGGKLSKKEVTKYLSNQSKKEEEPLNNAFAIALSKLSNENNINN